MVCYRGLPVIVTVLLKQCSNFCLQLSRVYHDFLVFLLPSIPFFAFLLLSLSRLLLSRFWQISILAGPTLLRLLGYFDTFLFLGLRFLRNLTFFIFCELRLWLLWFLDRYISKDKWRGILIWRFSAEFIASLRLCIGFWLVENA